MERIQGNSSAPRPSCTAAHRPEHHEVLLTLRRCDLEAGRCLCAEAAASRGLQRQCRAHHGEQGYRAMIISGWILGLVKGVRHPRRGTSKRKHLKGWLSWPQEPHQNPFPLRCVPGGEGPAPCHVCGEGGEQHGALAVARGRGTRRRYCCTTPEPRGGGKERGWAERRCSCTTSLLHSLTPQV